MKALFIAIAAQGSSEDSDLVDEMLRQVQKSVSFEKDDPKKAQLLIGHPFLHRLLKDMVNAEATSTAETGLKLSSQIAKICLRHFEDVVKSRGVFILIELMEHENTKPLVLKQLKAQKKEIAKIAKEHPTQVGL